MASDSTIASRLRLNPRSGKRRTVNEAAPRQNKRFRCPKVLNEMSRTEQLPHDLLAHIVSFLPTLAEKSRTSVLSRRWRYVWHNADSLDFDADTMPLVSREQFQWAKRQEMFVALIDCVIEARVALPHLPPVKELRIRDRVDKTHSEHIDRWIDFAIANRVETLHLEFSLVIHRNNMYKLSEGAWYRNPSGASHLKCLKSLSLSCVDVNKQFIEFILSSCPLLEELVLHCRGSYKDLNVSGVPPLRLRRLEINADKDSGLLKLSAPCLTTFRYNLDKFNPQKIDVPMLKDLAVGSSHFSIPIMEYLEPFWSYLPQLERLELLMEEPVTSMLERIPEMVNLKYLMMTFYSDTDPIFHRIINLINACPLLETFALQVYDGDMIQDLFRPRRSRGKLRKQRWCELEKRCSFKCLKAVELYFGDGCTIDQDVVKFIIANAPYLETLTYDLRMKHKICISFPYCADLNTVEEFARKLCKGHPNDINITVIG